MTPTRFLLPLVDQKPPLHPSCFCASFERKKRDRLSRRDYQKAVAFAFLVFMFAATLFLMAFPVAELMP